MTLVPLEKGKQEWRLEGVLAERVFALGSNSHLTPAMLGTASSCKPSANFQVKGSSALENTV